MKKTIVRKTEIQLQLSDIGTKLDDIAAKLDDIAAKLDDLSILVRQQTELLRRPAPNEPEYKPSAYAESLSNRPLREKSELTAHHHSADYVPAAAAHSVHSARGSAGALGTL